MPGYKQLPHFVQGPVADKVRAAHESEHPDAVCLLEEALSACMVEGGPLPGWLCGRLAALYRSLGRVDDEVRLLEHYRSTQVDDAAMTRFDARLGKARILADRQCAKDNGALSSIRDIKRRLPRRPECRASDSSMRRNSGSDASLAPR